MPVAAPAQSLSRLVAVLNLPGVSNPLNESAQNSILSAINETLVAAGVNANLSIGTVQVSCLLQ